MSIDDKIVFIRDKLSAALSPSHLEIIDESHKHIGHPGAKAGGSHYALTISGDAFTGKNLIQCHRLIYAALGDAMGKEIHALRIKVLR